METEIHRTDKQKQEQKSDNREKDLFVLYFQWKENRIGASLR